MDKLESGVLESRTSIPIMSLQGNSSTAQAVQIYKTPRMYKKKWVMGTSLMQILCGLISFGCGIGLILSPFSTFHYVPGGNGLVSPAGFLYFIHFYY